MGRQKQAIYILTEPTSAMMEASASKKQLAFALPVTQTSAVDGKLGNGSPSLTHSAILLHEADHSM